MTPWRRLDSVLKKACFGSFFQMMSWTHRQIIPMWTEIWWRTKKEKMDVATGRTWTSFEWRGMRGNIHIYRYILEEYWQIFVHDGLVPRGATDLQASAQPKAVFICHDSDG